MTGMAEYIERKAMRDLVKSIDWYSVRRGKLITGANSSENALYKANDIYSAIDNAPAADVAPVVRCKDCEHLVNATVNGNGFLICDISDMETAPDDFCSHGDRREEAGP